MAIMIMMVSSCSQPDFAMGELYADAKGINHIEITIPVKLKVDGEIKYQVTGTLSYSGEAKGKILQILLSGGGYGPAYYDFPYEKDTYSYVAKAANEGYVLFNLSRIGIGKSSRPPGNKVNLDANSIVIHQVIETLTKNEEIPMDFRRVITVGHSMGSVMAIDHAVKYPGDVNGVILTGILHNTNPEYTEKVRDGSKLAIFDSRFMGKIWDFTYFTSKPGMREEMFYFKDNAEKEVIAVDEETRETLTLGEIISIAKYDRELTRDIAVPVLIVNGEKDFTSCGGALDCSDPEVVIPYEEQFFAEAAELEILIIPETGHVINLHRSAPDVYERMLDWIDRKI